MMRLQLDLRIEAANLSIFRKNFKPRTTAWFPFPYTQFTTRQVLVEEFAQGIPLSDFMENGGGVFQQDIADEGLDAFLPNIETKIHSLNQMSLNKYWQDFSHTDTKKDPQAWQAELSKIDKEGFRPQLIFIDTGLVTELNATNRRNFLDLFKAVAEFDGYKSRSFDVSKMSTA
ncbi:hypothetical protein EYC84_006806 [Monilinia fructicola]|uniref:ABC1 atypical kinase-like domain-containing protein n=1 Tax=Monilinia fructicola TaxID=38448 RepID=A0A5M9K8C6_MONFR|nr:hypothetical protein EYC84_006806 [Monilinia fructicola]